MTPPAGIELITTSSSDKTALHLEVHGFVDYDCADHFLALTSQPLTDRPELRALHLDCSHLEGLDSMGLAMLLMLHRRTTAAGVTLFLDNRRPALERMLDITGALAHLVPDHKDTASASGEAQGVAYRPAPEGGTAANHFGRGERPHGPETS